MMVQSDGGRSPLVVHWFVDYNPFYVLSAMCMLFGVFAINNSLNWSPIPLRNLLTMIVTLNVYEAALIGLAMLLLGVNIRRDALLLMLIEAFFLVDVGFLNMEVFTVNYAVGLIVNGLLMLAAVVKLALLFRMAGLPVVDGKFAFVVLALAVLYAIPGIFAIASQPNDVLSPMWVFVAWWLAGFLPVAFVILAGSFEIFTRSSGGAAGADRIIGRTLILLPLLSLVAHLCLENWVYKVTFEPSNIAPLLLGMAVAIGRLDRHASSLAWRHATGAGRSHDRDRTGRDSLARVPDHRPGAGGHLASAARADRLGDRLHRRAAAVPQHPFRAGGALLPGVGGDGSQCPDDQPQLACRLALVVERREGTDPQDLAAMGHRIGGGIVCAAPEWSGFEHAAPGGCRRSGAGEGISQI